MAEVDLGQRCEKVACLDMLVPRLDEPALRLPARLAAGLPYDLVQLGRSDAKRLGGLLAHAPIVELVERRELGDYVFVLGAVASRVFVLNWRGRPWPAARRRACVFAVRLAASLALWRVGWVPHLRDVDFNRHGRRLPVR